MAAKMKKDNLKDQMKQKKKFKHERDMLRK
jgi:hypothetical protein